MRSLPLSTRLVLGSYNLLFPFVLVVLLPGFLLRMIRRGKYRHKFGQRFAIYSPRVRQRLAAERWIWIHAVSVGEMVMALKLAHELRAQEPTTRVLLSTTTSTGFGLARKSLEPWMELIYNPLDMRFIVRRAMALIQPRQLVLVDKEIWPNLVSQAYCRGIPVSVVNARLSPRSERRFGKFRRVVSPVFGLLDHVCVQEQEDGPRWAQLGVRPGAIRCVGSIKFDEPVDVPARVGEFVQLLRKIGVEPDAPVLLGGSTFKGEERILAELLLRLRGEFPQLFLIITPRHVERSREVIQELVSLGLKVQLRTAAGATDTTERPDCLLVDTTGELSGWYHTATVCFIGKSITARGGQNPVEPLTAGKPVVFGPNMQNFDVLVRQLLAARGAIQIQDPAELDERVAEFLRKADLREETASNGASVVSGHRGATARTAALLLGEVK